MKWAVPSYETEAHRTYFLAAVYDKVCVLKNPYIVTHPSKPFES